MFKYKAKISDYTQMANYEILIKKRPIIQDTAF